MLLSAKECTKSGSHKGFPGKQSCQSAVGCVVPEGNASSLVWSVMRFATQKHILRWNDDLPISP
jgi:hypothetical protein